MPRNSLPGEPASRTRLTDELLDELTSWTPRDRWRALGAWHASGLSIAHLNVITILQADGPMSMGRLADALGISVSSATGIVGRMEERRLVVRQGSTTDRRVVEVHLGDGATGVFEDIEQARRDHLRDVLSRVAPGDLEAFLRGLRAVRAARAQVKHERHEGSESPAQ